MKKAFPLIVVGIISSLLIFYQFNFVPKNLSFDEVEFGRLALTLSGKPYQPYSPLATGHSTLYFYVILLSFKIFGVNNFGLRFPAALFGVLSVLLFYLIVKKIFNKQSPLFYVILSIIFLSLRWFFNFARFSFEATFLLFFELASIYFLFNSSVILNAVKDLSRMRDNSNRLRDSSPPKAVQNDTWWLFLSGLFAGLAFNSYTPGRIFFLLPLGFVILNTFQDLGSRNKFGMTTMKRLLYFLVSLIVIIAPLSLYLSSHQDARVERLLFWKNKEMTVTEKINGTLQNVTSIAGMFNVKGDLNGRHNYPGKPALNPLLGILFIAGIFISLKQMFSKNPDNKYSRFFVLYFLLSLFPSIMIYPWENPNMLRTFTAIPAVVYFVGQSLIVVLNFFQDPGKRFRNKFGMTMVIILIVLSSAYEVRTYFKYQAPVFDKAFEIRMPLNKIIK